MRAAAVAIAGILALAGPAAGTGPAKPWATVNVCDTQAHPDAFGVRASMPGLGTVRTHMYLRIHAEYQAGNGIWRDLGESGDSGWLDAGKALRRSRQVGRTFTITPPAAGQATNVLRATVAFEWRRGAKVLRRARALTTAGHRGLTDADPADFSAATCSIA